MAFDKTKFLKRFVEEAAEHVQAINDGLLMLEKKPDDSETINSIFRSAHTIKGSSKIMKMPVIAELAHRLEDALDAVRRGSVEFSENISELFFISVDTISDLLDKVNAGEELPGLSEKLCEDLEAVVKGKLPSGTSVEKKAVAVCDDAGDGQKRVEPAVIEEVPVKQDATVRIKEGKLDELIKLMGEIVSAQAKLGMRILELGKIEKHAKEVQNKMSYFEYDKDSKKRNVYNSVTELSNEITQLLSGLKDDTVLQDNYTGELQENSLKMRMFPVATMFNAYHRVVREAAKSSDKKVDFIVKGDDTELDKKIIEKIRDPFIHMIRNSIDHGIETRDVRLRNNKSETGTIQLTAEYEGGNVLIKLIDDGAGLRLQKIKEKSVARKLFTEAELEKFSEKQIMNIIFEPGFSTIDFITDTSGRGVGMDVVKKNIVGDLNGSIHVFSKEGKGTTFEIRLPLTLAVMHMMVIEVSGMIFSVPATHIDEVLRVKKADVIDVVDKKAIKLREQIIPVVRMDDVLGLTSGESESEEPLIIIAAIGGEKMGLIIDKLLREENRTIKALPPHLKNIPFVSGVTISGNRMLDNVLNLPKIIESAKNVKVRKSTAASDEGVRKINILVVDDSVSTREIEKSILESYGYNVNVAGDGIEALEKVDEFQYDLVVTDIEMPGMDGLTLTKSLKDKESYQDVPVILISSRDKDEDKRKGLLVGADAYIVKDNFDQDTLIDVIQNLVGI